MGCMNDTGPTPLQWLLHEVDARMGPDQAQKVREILKPMVGQMVYVSRRDITLAEIKADADAMLANGVSRTIAAIRLSRRHAIAIRQAQRHVAAALTRRSERAAIDRVAK